LSSPGRVALIAGEQSPLRAALAARLEDAGETVASIAPVRSRREADAAVAELERRLGPVDLLVTTPPAAAPASLGEITAADLQETIDVALKSPFLLSQAVLGGMRERGGGRLVYVTSVAGLMGRAYVSHVAAVARAVIALMRTLAVEEAPALNANAVAVGPMDGEALLGARVRSLVEREGLDPAAARERTIEQIPLGRLTEMEEIADAVRWLARPESAMTGQVVALAGGSELQVWP
jgi:NAD(P)-dependent dehydrogenase (short-subunit alcohol dehydrogenase family)